LFCHFSLSKQNRFEKTVIIVMIIEGEMPKKAMGMSHAASFDD